jgi:pantoate--beta-alanine ligase
LIRRIVEDLDMDVNIVVSETIREPDGLAMSSRNAYLTPREREVAPIVYQSLCSAKELFEGLQEGESIESSTLREKVESTLKTEPLVSEVQYVAIDSKATMRPLQNVLRSEGAVISLACKVGSVRLIDNIIL